jgi:hypothetical protein
VRFKAYPVQHSVRAPAVGYRVSAKGARFFYVPDVAGLPDAPNTLRGISVYIGDGATMTRSMVRKKNGSPCLKFPLRLPRVSNLGRNLLIAIITAVICGILLYAAIRY